LPGVRSWQGGNDEGAARTGGGWWVKALRRGAGCWWGGAREQCGLEVEMAVDMGD